MYTTGEIAKICHVSIRTVQYYDKEKIVCPSHLSDGGRRQYSEDDLQQFQTVCLYRKLGFSLHDIRDILECGEQNEILLKLLCQQEEIMNARLKELQLNKEKIVLLIEEMKTSRCLAVTNYDDLEKLLVKKKKYHKIDMLTYYLNICYVILMSIGTYIASQMGGIYPFVMVIIAGIILIDIIYFNTSFNTYLCPQCHYQFKISFFQDLFSFHNGKQGKYLKCPQCHQKNWMKGTYRL